MQAILTSKLGRAREVLALILPFSPDAGVIYDPNTPTPEGIDFMSYPTDPNMGFHIVPVAADLDNNTEGAFCVYGHVTGENMVINPRLKKELDPAEVHTILDENVGLLDHHFSVLDLQAKHGHPIYNMGLKYGPNLVAVGNPGAYDAELVWSSQPYDKKQEQS